MLSIVQAACEAGGWAGSAPHSDRERAPQPVTPVPIRSPSGLWHPGRPRALSELRWIHPAPTRMVPPTAVFEVALADDNDAA